MARRIVPFAEVLDIVERDSYLEEDSSGDEDLHLNPNPSIEDGTTLPLEDIASISRAFGRLIPPCERDSLLVLDEDLAEEDEDGFDGEPDVESSEKEDQPIFSGSVVQEDAESDNISEFVGGRVLESDKERDLTDNRELEPSVVSSTPTIGQLLDDASLTPSATATLSNASEQVQTTRGRGRGRGRGYVGGDEQRLRREYRGGRRGRGRSRSIGRGKGSSRDVGRGNSTGRGRGRSRGRGRQGRNLLSGTEPADTTFQWTTFDSHTPPRRIVPFQEDYGVAPIAADVTNPFDCLALFCDAGAIDLLVENTNAYAYILYTGADTPALPWEPVSREEMYAFLGLSIAMGVVRLPSLQNYWSTHPILEQPWFRRTFARDRFLQILRVFHISDNSQQQNHQDDKLFKVRPLIDLLAERFKIMYQPGEHLSIDESMIGTKCRLSFIQYLPNKPTKWGVKMWVLADSETAYISRFAIYTGKDNYVLSSGKGLAYDVVFNLLQDLLDKHHKVYFDNFYSSPTLSKDLLERSTYSCGTVRTNRKGFPSQITPPDLPSIPPKSYKFVRCGDITVARWHEKRDVYLISTMHGNETTIVTRRSRRGEEQLRLPTMVADYNHHMGGVDVADQYMCYYGIAKKTRKWWKHIAFRLLDMAILNAYIIFYHNTRSSMDQLQFRLHLAEKLAIPLIESRAQIAVPRTPANQLTRLRGKHFPQKQATRGRCRVCGNLKTSTGQRKDTKTNYFCPSCKVFLCVGECFRAYHTKYTV